MMSFEEVKRCYHWDEIRNCPGRYIAKGLPLKFSVGDLLNEPVDEVQRRSPNARDAVIIIPLEAGGLISFKREDGSYLHTLNTPEGFARKLADLVLTV